MKLKNGISKIKQFFKGETNYLVNSINAIRSNRVSKFFILRMIKFLKKQLLNIYKKN